MTAFLPKLKSKSLYKIYSFNFFQPKASEIFDSILKTMNFLAILKQKIRSFPHCERIFSKIGAFMFNNVDFESILHLHLRHHLNKMEENFKYGIFFRLNTLLLLKKASYTDNYAESIPSSQIMCLHECAHQLSHIFRDTSSSSNALINLRWLTDIANLTIRPLHDETTIRLVSNGSNENAEIANKKFLFENGKEAITFFSKYFDDICR